MKKAEEIFIKFTSKINKGYPDYTINDREGFINAIEDYHALKNHFKDDKCYETFMKNLSEMLSRLSFEEKRKIIETKNTSASMVLKLEEYEKLPQGEGYYLSLSKIGKVVLDSASDIKK